MKIGDYMRFTFMCKREKPAQRLDKRVAIIGAGPAGLAAAGYLSCKGYSITIFERLPLPGGMMIFAIPDYRIPRNRVLLGCQELEEVFDVEIKTSCKVMADNLEILGDSLAKESKQMEKIILDFDATVIATGTWIPKNLQAEGANVKGIYSALEYLFRNRAYELDLIPEREIFELGSNVVVIGSGLVAVDAALDALQAGCNVRLVSIEKLHEAPAGIFEINRLKEKGVQHIERTVVKKVIGREKVEALELINVDAEIRQNIVLKFEQIPGTERIIENIDNVIVAIGQTPTPPFKIQRFGIKLKRGGEIEVDDNFMTAQEKVYATGDVVIGVSKIGRAFQSGLKTAYWVDRHFQESVI